MNVNIFGPAMVDMKYVFDTTTFKISLFNTFQAFGYLLGSLCKCEHIFLWFQIMLIFRIIH